LAAESASAHLIGKPLSSKNIEAPALTSERAEYLSNHCAPSARALCPIDKSIDKAKARKL
jgi:hypothetical protein